ncbi:PREDICTED: transcription factor BIM2 isoform X2 [Nelumbo nucifera]|uniref:Transcription factor BIM2 isoform X2 n=1 Tax=Nelumbo nucifera TaxID=4432 RepID=A0A1U8A8P9_NELNU|nr:PREDICTED: transcription factor BIM2 isoform X2 [Nelumbo nucifera]
MELPQPRPFGTEGKKTTHDFLSLYGHPSFQHQDPRPPHGSIDYSRDPTESSIWAIYLVGLHLLRGFLILKTHDFLQPLERLGKKSGKGENTVEAAPNPIEKPLPPPPPSVEHALPGGIGTYSIGYNSNFNHRSVPPKPETSVFSPTSSTEKNGEVNNKANSNGGSYSGGAFSLWNQSVVKEKGALVKLKDTVAQETQVVKEPVEQLGQWSSEERPLRTLFTHHTSLISQSSSKQPEQKSQRLIDMMKSAKGHQEEEEDDEEEFASRKEVPFQKVDLTVKVDGKNINQKTATLTPRSKHSATEQRRRSKINDRFQILRDLIPHSDQKRDKASFLLEVIEYIQFLQEKVQKYDAAFPGWNQEPTKLVPWRNIRRPGESVIDHSQALKNGPGPGIVFTGKFDDNNIAVSVSPPMLANSQNPLDADKAVPLPIPLQANMFTPVVRGGGLSQPPQRPLSDADNVASHPQSQLWQGRVCTTEFPVTSDILNEQDDMTIEGGTINISSVYSQGLLNNLTQALQSCGVDLSQASMSVQIDLGKRTVGRLAATTSSAKEDPSSNQAMTHSRVASSGEDSDQASKRLKTEKS